MFRPTAWTSYVDIGTVDGVAPPLLMLTLRTGTGIRFSWEFRNSFDAGIDNGRCSNNLLSNSRRTIGESAMVRDALAANSGCFRMDLYLDGDASVAEFDESLLLFAVVAREDVRELTVDGVRELAAIDAAMAGIFLAVVGKSMATEICC